MKTKTILLILYLIITTLVIAHIDHEIKSFNLNFYSGKDGGYFVRFDSIIALTTVYFVIQAIKPKRNWNAYILHTLAGFCSAFILGILCYLFLPTDYPGTTFHVITILLSYSSYYMFRKIKLNPDFAYNRENPES